MMRSIATNASVRFVRAMWSRAFDDRTRRSSPDGSQPRSADLEWLQRENARLLRAVDELVLLNELAKDIGSTPDSTRILKKITSRARRVVRAEQSAIYLIDPGEPGTETRVRVASNPENRLRVHLQDSVVGWMGLHREALLVDDCRHDSRFRDEARASDVRSLLAAPLLLPPDASSDQPRLLGVLTASNKCDHECFTAEDARLFDILASQTAQVIERARLYDEERELDAWNKELVVAGEIQQRLVPIEPPVVDGYDVAAITRPAQSVGGDFYDWVHPTGGPLTCYLGDVAGKGLSAALLMSSVLATLRGQAVARVSPGECLERANDLLRRSTAPERFATLFYASIDVAQHTVRYANAGHNHPFLVAADGRVRRLRSTAPVLGVLERWTTQLPEETLDVGDLVVVFSDGLPDALDAGGREYGETRLESIVRADRDLPPAALTRTIVADVSAHSAGTDQTDDVTVMAIRRTA